MLHDFFFSTFLSFPFWMNVRLEPEISRLRINDHNSTVTSRQTMERFDHTTGNPALLALHDTEVQPVYNL